MRFISPAKLKKLGVVGMNKRNVCHIAENNPRHLYPRVDDKLQTKLLAQEAGIAVPKLLGVIRVQKHVKQLVPFLKDQQDFVMKPAKGSGGKGILVIAGREGDKFIASNGKLLGETDLHRHASNTLSGLFSLGGNPDVAMIEERVIFSDEFEDFTYHGVPDIRIIVYKGYPIMSMARLATANSGGKANLHQGAVGAGIDISSGSALLAIQNGLPISHHPDTKSQLSKLVIPHWEECLRLASMCYEVTELGYLGADIVLDANRGPLILELNARPGLAIQMANGQGLQPRIDTINSFVPSSRTVEERVALSMQHFGSA